MLTASALAKWRELHGLTQRDAAVLADTVLSSYRNWETGRNEPKADVIAKLERLRPGLHALMTGARK